MVEISQSIYCSDIYEYEKDFDIKYKKGGCFYGHLINKNLFDSLIYNIRYNEYKNKTRINYSVGKNYFNFEQIKFTSLRNLKIALNYQEKYRLINDKLYNKIKSSQKQEIGMKCQTQNNNELIIEFENGERIIFNRNNDIIQQSSIKQVPNEIIAKQNINIDLQQNNDIIVFNNEQIPKNSKSNNSPEQYFKAIISHYIFNLRLINNIKESTSSGRTFKYHCILINRDLFYRKFYLYNELVQKILKNKEINNEINKNINKKPEENENLINAVYLNIKNCFINKDIKYVNVEDVNEIQMNYMQNSTNVIKYPCRFEILSDYSFSIIKNFANDMLNYKTNFIINNDKIIFNINYIDKETKKKTLFLLIGTFEYVFFEKLIIRLNDENSLNHFFNNLMRYKYDAVIQTYLYDKKNTQSIFFYQHSIPNNSNDSINAGKILKNIDNNIETNDDKYFNTLSQTLNTNSIAHNSEKHSKIIKFLIQLYFLNKKIKYLTEQPLTLGTKDNPYYIINKELINKYKILYNYSQISNIITQDKNIINIINKYKSNNPYIPDDKINEFTIEVMEIFQKNFVNCLQIKKGEEIEKELQNPEIYNIKLISTVITMGDISHTIQYYNNFYLLDNNLMKLLLDINNDNGRITSDKNYTFFFGGNMSFYTFISEKRKFIVLGGIKNEFFESDIVIRILLETFLGKMIECIKIYEYDKLFSSFKSGINNVYLCDYKVIAHKVIKGNINLGRATNAQKNNEVNIYQKNKELINLILFFINSEEIRKKCELPIQHNNDDEQYYLLNYSWFIKFLELNNMNNLLDSIVKYKDNYLSIVFQNNISENEKITQILSKLNKTLLSQIKKNQKDYSQLRNPELYQTKLISIIGSAKNNINFYNNCFLLNKRLYDLLIKELSINLSANNIKRILFGENKIFIVIKNNDNYIIEVCNLSVYNFFIVDLLLEIFDQNIEETIEIIKNNGFQSFYDKFLTFDKKQEYSNPIFISNKKFIGFCYKFHDEIKDYSIYNSININLVQIIKLKFNYDEIRTNMYSNKISNNYYYLVNKNFIDEYKNNYEYSKIENEFGVNKNLIKFMNEIQNKDPTDDENIYLIIKNSLSNYNELLNQKQNYINNNNYSPNIIVFKTINELLQETDIMIYDSFELINPKILNIKLFPQFENTTECFFIKNYIFVKMPKSLNSQNINDNNTDYLSIILICSLNNNDSLVINYFLIYDKENYSNKYFHKFVENFETSDIQQYFDELQFYDCNSEFLYNENNEKIGLICKNINENEINSNKNNYKGIKNEFTEVPKIGLKNVGATCYMNATLQCFCQIEKFINFFKYNNQNLKSIIQKYNSEKKNSLSSSFKLLINHLWPSKLTNNNNNKNKSYAPYEFKEKISKMDSLFKGIQANDSKDLVNFIIMTLHEELNKAQPLSNISSATLLEQSNQQIMLKRAMNIFMAENRSIISDIFYGMNGGKLQCSNCKNIIYNYQTYFFLLFPLEEVRKFKINNFQQQFMQMNQNMMCNNNMQFQQNFNNFQNINSVTIYDCFNYDQRFDMMSGENSVFCNNCQNLYPFMSKNFITTGPEILIIVLNRGKGIEFNVKLEFYEDLNLQNFIQLQNTGVYYKLIGVVTHMGLSGASGHFVAICKSPIDDNWYNYNDDLVTPVNNFKEQVIDYAMPYILFYQKATI